MTDELFQSMLDQEDKEANELIEGKVSELLKKKNMHIAVAESLTGGLLSYMLTTQPGSSAFFIGGIVCYHPRIKINYLGVDARTITKYGVVSEEVAREMALGIRKRFGSHLGLSVTGVAGPDIHSNMPVGTVWAALSSEDGIDSKKFLLKGNREDIRLQAARSALNLVWVHFGQFEV